MTTLTLTAGTKIGIGQVLTARMFDSDTSEPLTLVYPTQPGENPVGVAMSNAEEWQDVVVVVQGIIRGALSIASGIAGENLNQGMLSIVVRTGSSIRVPRSALAMSLQGRP